MQNPLYYAMVMEAVGEADVTFAGIDNTTGDVLLAGQMVIGLKPGISTISSIGLCDIPEFKEVKEAFLQSATALCAPTRIPVSWPESLSLPATRSGNFWAGSRDAPWSAIPPWEADRGAGG